MRTEEEKAALLTWADSFMARNPYVPEPEPENEPSPPDVSRDWDGTARIHGDTTNAPSSLEGPPTLVQLQLQQVQAQLAMLMAAIAGGNSADVAPSPAAVVRDCNGCDKPPRVTGRVVTGRGRGSSSPTR
ncbi:hypothetical protein EDB85DRAFT_2158488 [Lactarius pseudohatsudake]|nr:hypothetical protein EDB85DRAFT_2158488 [Lactarius pseudohatsudake]